MATVGYENARYHEINVPMYKIPHTPLHTWYPGRLTSPNDYWDLRQLPSENQAKVDEAFNQRKTEIKEAFAELEMRARDLGRGPEGMMGKTPLFAAVEPEAMIEEPSLKQVDVSHLPFNEEELRNDKPLLLPANAPDSVEASQLREDASDMLYKGNSVLRGLGGTYDYIEYGYKPENGNLEAREGFKHGAEFSNAEESNKNNEKCSTGCDIKSYILPVSIAIILALLLCFILKRKK